MNVPFPKQDDFLKHQKIQNGLNGLKFTVQTKNKGYVLKRSHYPKADFFAWKFFSWPVYMKELNLFFPTNTNFFNFLSPKKWKQSIWNYVVNILAQYQPMYFQIDCFHFFSDQNLKNLVALERRDSGKRNFQAKQFFSGSGYFDSLHFEILDTQMRKCQKTTLQDLTILKLK